MLPLEWQLAFVSRKLRPMFCNRHVNYEVFGCWNLIAEQYGNIESKLGSNMKYTTWENMLNLLLDYVWNCCCLRYWLKWIAVPLSGKKVRPSVLFHCWRRIRCAGLCWSLFRCSYMCCMFGSWRVVWSCSTLLVFYLQKSPVPVSATVTCRCCCCLKPPNASIISTFYAKRALLQATPIM